MPRLTYLYRSISEKEAPPSHRSGQLSGGQSNVDSSKDYSWILGKWVVQTPYGTEYIEFKRNGLKGRCFLLDIIDNSAPIKKPDYGDYYIDGNKIHIQLDNETIGLFIEIHDDGMLSTGKCFYKKLQ